MLKIGQDIKYEFRWGAEALLFLTGNETGIS